MRVPTPSTFIEKMVSPSPDYIDLKNTPKIINIDPATII